MRTCRKLWAFYKRDWQLALTYRVAFLLDVAQTAALFASFFFIGKLFSPMAAHPSLATYGGDYFRFVFVGIAFSGFMSTAQSTVTQAVAFERGHGTLEAILLTRTSMTTVAIGRTLAHLSIFAVKVTLYLLAGVVLLGADLSQANWIALLPILALTVTTFLGLGMVSGGFFLLTREIIPLELVLGWASRFLAGVFFPVTLLPGWLQQISHWLPLTYSLEAIRGSLILGTPLRDLMTELGVLLAFSALLLPVGFLFFQWALVEAKRSGRLSLGD